MTRSQKTQRPAATALLLGLLSAGAAAVAGVKMPFVEAAAGEIGGMLTAVATGQHGELIMVTCQRIHGGPWPRNRAPSTPLCRYACRHFSKNSAVLL